MLEKNDVKNNNPPSQEGGEDLRYSPESMADRFKKVFSSGEGEVATIVTSMGIPLDLITNPSYFEDLSIEQRREIASCLGDLRFHVVNGGEVKTVVNGRIEMLNPLTQQLQKVLGMDSAQYSSYKKNKPVE